ncbi:MAG TPA: glycosyltransferase family 2 protein [Solirubrobacteraceae bacterium]|nr:glycosyltransferase family 2 protein [Solirubrobacteraceae bacterium]
MTGDTCRVRPFAVSAAEPSLTVAVLSYDGRGLLEIVLPSLEAQRFRDFHTVVVDNGSSDGTVAWLAEAWPSIEVVALPRNVGVTAALNACFDAARTELVALLNNDLELDPDCLGELVGAMREHPRAGSAAAKLLDFHDRGVLDGAGDVFIWQGTGARRGNGTRDAGQFDEPRAIFGACGAVAVYRRQALERVGRFDQRFFACYEDVDWAFRAQLAGWDCRYVPSAVAFHMGSVTLGTAATDFVRYHMWRNTIWLVVKDYPALALLRQAPRVLHGQLVHLRQAVRERRLRLWARAMRDAACGLPDALRRRRAVQRTRARSLRELDAVIGFDR